MTDADSPHKPLIVVMLESTPDPSRAWRAWFDDAQFHAQVEILAGLWPMVATTMLDAADAERERQRRAYEAAIDPDATYTIPKDAHP